MPLIRIGGKGDGAYLIPDDLKGITACFSPGVCKSKSFEDELARKYKIKSHMCDYTSSLNCLSTPIIEPLQTFEKLWLDLHKTPSSISLERWVKRLYPSTESGDLILQIDIEGAENRNLLHTRQQCLERFRIIAIEFHNLDVLRLEGRLKWHIKSWLAASWCFLLRPVISPLSNRGLLRKICVRAEQNLEPFLIGLLIKKLSKTHICVHAHANNNSHYSYIDQETGMNIPSLIELTYLRKDRFEGNPSDWISPQIPHELDIDTNAPDKPSMLLNSQWTKTERARPV